MIGLSIVNQLIGKIFFRFKHNYHIEYLRSSRYFCVKQIYNVRYLMTFAYRYIFSFFLLFLQQRHLNNQFTKVNDKYYSRSVCCFNNNFETKTSYLIIRSSVVSDQRTLYECLTFLLQPNQGGIHNLRLMTLIYVYIEELFHTPQPIIE